VRKVAVIVPVHNRRDTTLNYLKQMRHIDAGGLTLDMVIVDDGSTDGTAQAIREQYPDVVILQGDGNLWWTGAVNKGVQYALTKDYDGVLIMNDDLELDKDFLLHIMGVADKNPGSLVSSVVVNKAESGEEEVIAAGFGTFGFFSEIRALYAGKQYGQVLEEVIQCDLLTGSSLLIPTNVFRSIGMFDSKDFPHNWGDFEFTQRASLSGLSCFVATKSKVYTEHNPNYPAWYFFNSSRKDYLKNLFNCTKFLYGFRGIRKTSYMHRSFVKGTLLYIYRAMSLAKRIILKLVLTREALRKYMLRKIEKTGTATHLIRKLKVSD
jgi:GT2 family glycosyltransferase